MLNAMHLQNFKAFKNTRIPEFRTVNLVLGGQNVGKTSLLEAVVLASEGADGDGNNIAATLPSLFRPTSSESDSQRFWSAITGTPRLPNNFRVLSTFSEGTYGAVNAMSSDSGSSAYRTLGTHAITFVKTEGQVFNGSVPPKPIAFPISTKPAHHQVKLYGQMVIARKKKLVIDLLQRIDPRLIGIDAVAPDGEHRVYVELNDGHVLPLSQLGHGFAKLFELYAGLVVSDSKLALIDEIENGIHYSALPTVFQGIRALAESNGVQSIITTHSLEAIKAACEVFKDKPEDFQLIRLERTNDDNIRAVAIADESLKIVMASGWEMR